MKGNELELWIASLTTCAIFTTLIKWTPSIKQTLGKVLKVSAKKRFHCSEIMQMRVKRRRNRAGERIEK